MAVPLDRSYYNKRDVTNRRQHEDNSTTIKHQDISIQAPMGEVRIQRRQGSLLRELRRLLVQVRIPRWQRDLLRELIRLHRRQPPQEQDASQGRAGPQVT